MSDTKGWYFANKRRKRGRVAAALPIIIPRPGSTAVRMASSAVASTRDFSSNIHQEGLFEAGSCE